MRTYFLLPLALAGGLLSASAFAQDQTSPEYQEAKQRLQEGKALYGQGNIDGARLKFEQACSVLKTPACLRALGLSDFYTKRYLEALGNLQKALEDKELTTTQRKQVTDLMQQAYAQTGHLEITAPAGGRVRIDDTVDEGNAPLSDEVHVTAGQHIVSVTVDTHAERMTVDCAQGKLVKVDFTSKFPAASGATGGAGAQGNGGVGQPGGPGEGGEQHHAGGGVTRWIVGGAVAAVGLVGVGLGVGFLVDSGSASDDAANLRTQLGASASCPGADAAQCATLSGLKDRYDNGQTLGPVFLGVGVGLVVAGAATALLWPGPKKEQSTGLRVVPFVGRESGVAVLGAF